MSRRPGPSISVPRPAPLTRFRLINITPDSTPLFVYLRVCIRRCTSACPFLSFLFIIVMPRVVCAKSGDGRVQKWISLISCFRRFSLRGFAMRFSSVGVFETLVVSSGRLSVVSVNKVSVCTKSVLFIFGWRMLSRN